MTATQTQTTRVAIIGNPNTGKTTLFNHLTGFKARVGNYAGVTVERKIGPLKGSSGAVEIIDLPGTYSIAARSMDEMVAVDVFLGRREDEQAPEKVLIVVDASNLERNLFLATQILELGIPSIVILNMTDVAAGNGVTVDAQLLSERLGVPVISTVAAREQGLAEVGSALLNGRCTSAPQMPELFPDEFVQAAEELQKALIAAGCPEKNVEPFLARRVLLESSGMAEQRFVKSGGEKAAEAIRSAKARLQEEHKIRLVSLEARCRYGWITKILEGVVSREEVKTKSLTDRLDAVLVHKVWGTLIFATLMLIVFQAIYTWSAPFMDLIDGVFGALGGWVGGTMAEGPLQSLIVDGVIAGVGGVVIFLPQILFLFFFIGLLEDCGYMARAAFLMDRLLSRCGLSGRSFIPMLSSFACAIPGIMATRTIEDRRDRFATILVAPLMSCSARLPVYTLFIAAFVPNKSVLGGVFGLQGLTLFCMYLVGLVVAIPVALILKKTLLKGKTPTFIMELPPYKQPSWKTIFHRMMERGSEFLKRAGTIIFAVSVVVWALLYYPRPASVEQSVMATYATQIEAAKAEWTESLALAGDDPEKTQATIDAWLDTENVPQKMMPEMQRAVEATEALRALESEQENAVAGAYIRQSILGRMGQWVAPVVKPLGWDWRLGMAAIASFPAREVIVSTLGVIYDVGDADEESMDLRSKLYEATWPDGQPIFTLPVALSVMIFFALCAQCAATLAVMKRETNSWRWPVFAFAYMTGLAYIGAMITYHLFTAVLS